MFSIYQTKNRLLDLKRDSKENTDEYMDRIKPKLSHIHDVLFSGNKIEPHKSIIDNWWLTNNVYALSPFWKDENKNIIEYS